MRDGARTALIERIDKLLPQTQCRRCGYEGCRPYARAIASDLATINRCPPGGDATVAALAGLLERPALPLDRSRGEPRALAVARIDEDACIGCTLCMAACPVDAIVGAAGLMHTVLIERCTGCELCLPPCPVDCIALAPRERTWTTADADLARRRFADRAARCARVGPAGGAPAARSEPISAEDVARAQRRNAVAAALARARARRAARPPSRSRP